MAHAILVEEGSYTLAIGTMTDGIGDIVGSGFFSDELAANGAPFDQPTQFELVNCKAEPINVPVSN